MKTRYFKTFKDILIRKILIFENFLWTKFDFRFSQNIAWNFFFAKWFDVHELYFEWIISGKLVNSIRALPIIKYKPSKDGDKQCKICFNDFGKNEDVRLLPCLHRFHPECIDKWLRQQFKCPICRTSCIQWGFKWGKIEWKIFFFIVAKIAN